jgi:CRP-like cAMP-binding protein
LFLHHRNALGNKLLAALPRAERERLLDPAEPVRLELRDVVAERGSRVTHAWFPLTAFLSQVVPADRGHLEVGLVGFEGFLGLPLALGVGSSRLDAVVQGAGEALRVPARHFLRHLEQSAALRRVTGRYAHVVMSQLTQNAVCNRFHVVEQRLARWLLMSADRARSLNFEVTHAFLGMILGVRRVGVTQAARALSERGLIEYARGHIVIRDRRGLQGAACPCYRIDLDTYRDTMAR